MRTARARAGWAVLALVVAAAAVAGLALLLHPGADATWAAGDRGPAVAPPAAGTSAASPPAAATSTVAPAAAPSSFSTATVTPPRPLQLEPGPGQPVATDPPRSVSAGRVRVVVTAADLQPSEGGVEVDGYVAGLVEQSGVCTVTLTAGTRSARATGTAWPDASTTSCGSIVVPLAQLGPGTWRAVLSYASATSTGSSDPVDVTVP